MSVADPSTTPTESTRRVSVIALVGILAVGAGLVVANFLTSGRAAAVGAAAAYVPADAAFYVEMRLEPSAAQDGALRDFLGAFPAIEGIDLDRPLHEQLVEKVDEMLADSEAGITWEADVAPWFDGSLAVAVSDIPVDELSAAPINPMDPSVPLPLGGEVPPVVLALGVSDRAAAEAAIDRILASAEAPAPVETVHGGVTISSVGDGTDAASWALVDDLLLLGPTVEGVTAALDTHADPNATLAEADHLSQLVAELPNDWLAFVSYDMTDVVSATWDQMASMEPEMSDAFRSLLEHQSLRGAMAFTADGDRLSMESAAVAPTGPFAMENADRGLADQIPGDALYYAEGGNIGASLSAVIGPMTDALAETPEGAEQVDMIEAALGADLEELVSWIDDGAVAIGWDGEQPYGGALLVPNDRDAAERRLDQLVTFASLASLDPSSGVTVDEREVAGTTVTTIRWAGADMELFTEPTALSIEIAVTDDRALIGIGDRFVERILSPDGSSLADEARYTDAVADLGAASNAGVAWVDLAGVRAAIEEAAGPMIDEMDGDGAYQRDVLPWLEPLDRLVQVTVVSGDLVVQRSALLVE